MDVDQKLVHTKRLRHSRLEGDELLTSFNKRRIDSFPLTNEEDIVHAFLRGCTHWEKKNWKQHGKVR